MKAKIITPLLESKNFAPLLLFFVCVLFFGPLMPALGFYWDDWLVIFHVQTERIADLITLYSFDRPLSAWTAVISAPLLASSSMAWHLFSLFFRWLSSYLLYLSIVQILPKRKKMAMWISVLFAIYPAYTLQAVSVAFSQHWISYALFLFSIYAMGKAVLIPEKKFSFILLALFSALLHLVTLEYFAGVELLRPIYLLTLFPKKIRSVSSRLKVLFNHWWPYLILLILWAFWRMFVVEFAVEPHPPILLSNLRAAPLATLFEFANTIWESYRSMLWTAWQRPLSTVSLNWNDNLFLAGLVIAVIFSIMLSYLLKNWQSDNSQNNSQKAYGQIASIGAFSIFLGLLPIWMIGESPVQSGYNERFALPALLGTSMFIVSALYYFLKSNRIRSLVFFTLVGIAFTAQFHSAIRFRDDWEQQSAYFRQLAWRAPSIESNTALIFFAPLTDFMPASSSSAAINSIYEQSRSKTYVDYWYFDLDRSRHVRKIEAGDALNSNYRGMLFEAQNAEALLYFYQPKNSCLWLLSPIDQANPYLPEEVRFFTAYSTPARINPNINASNIVSDPVFNLKADQSWCYAYQQADRMEQLRDWSGIEDEMKAAINLGLGPENALEWLPLLSAYINLGQWPFAEELSHQIDQQDSRNGGMLCATWEKWQVESGVNELGQKSWQRVADTLQCELERP